MFLLRITVEVEDDGDDDDSTRLEALIEIAGKHSSSMSEITSIVVFFLIISPESILKERLL